MRLLHEIRLTEASRNTCQTSCVVRSINEKNAHDTNGARAFSEHVARLDRYANSSSMRILYPLAANFLAAAVAWHLVS